MLALLMLTTFASCSEEPPVMPQQQNSVPTERKKPDVQDNFYGYANFDYFTTAQLPNDKDSIDSFDIIGDQMKANMAEMLEQMITDNSDDPYEQMVREYKYAKDHKKSQNEKKPKMPNQKKLKKKPK